MVLRPPYYRPPKDKCELCGINLWGKNRYKVKLFLRTRPYDKVVFKELVVCSDCLPKVLGDKSLREKFRIRYRKMRVLGWGSTVL